MKLCFVLMVFGISAKAQEKETCFYHVSFYKCQWNCCERRDTIPRNDLKGNLISDTVIIDTTNSPYHFVLERRDIDPFIHDRFQVTSMDGGINYEIYFFRLSIKLMDSTTFVEFNHDPMLTVDALMFLPNFQNFDSIKIDSLKISDPNLDNEITLPGISVHVE